MKLYTEEQVKQIQQAILCNHKDAIMDENYCLSVTTPIELPMSNNKQSSVEWFKKELEDYGTSERLKIDWKTFDELFEQAKVMHKLEMIQFALFWSHEYANRDVIEKEYNETFGGIHE